MRAPRLRLRLLAALVAAALLLGLTPRLAVAQGAAPPAGACAECGGAGSCTSSGCTSDASAGCSGDACTSGEKGAYTCDRDSCSRTASSCSGGPCTASGDGLCTGPSCSTAPPPAKREAADVRDITRWDVSYEDAALGLVQGEAFVNWQGETPGNPRIIGTVRVTLRNPKTKQETQLSTRDFMVSGRLSDRIVTTLRGVSPSGPTVAAPSASGPQLKVSQGQSIEVRLGAGHQTYDVKSKAIAPSNTVALNLQVGPTGVLSGEWSHFADPLTERDGARAGRLGGYRLLNEKEMAALNDPPPEAEDQIGIPGGFLGVQTGFEEWWPKPTVIAHIAAIEDQLAFRQGLPVYHALPYFEKHFDEAAGHRTLLVVGRNLPLDKGRPLAPIYAGRTSSESGAVLEPSFTDPHILATTQDESISPENAALFDHGWQRIVDELNDKHAAGPGGKLTKDDVARGMEAALIRVTVTEKYNPGPQWLIWGGSARPWLLQFGDNTIDMHFVRAVASDADGTVTATEPADEFFTPEQVAIELVPGLVRPVESIPIKVGPDLKNLVAMEAVPVGKRGVATLYRTPFFRVGGDGIGKPGGGFVAYLDQRKLLDRDSFQFVAAPEIKASLSLTPGSRKPDRLMGLWKDAVLAAAASRGIVVEDLSTVSHRTIDTVDTIPVTLADLAAMLLLRDNFVDMMEQQATWLGALTEEADLQKFLDWIKPFVLYEPASYPPNFYAIPQPPGGRVVYWGWLSQLVGDARLDAALNAIDDLDAELAMIGSAFKALPGVVLNGGAAPPAAPSSPFAKLEVTGIDGTPTTLYAAINTLADPPSGISPDRLRQWKIDLGREAAAKYLKVVQASLEHARSIKNTDVKELLKLTGVGFEATIKHVVPRLLVLQGNDPQSFGWVPDRVGRAAVLNLYTTAVAARAHEDLSDIETQYVVMAASAVLMVPALVSEGAFAAIVSLAGNTLLWEVNSVEQIIETHKTHVDLEIEFGNAAVLGTERLGEAAQKRTDWYQTFLSIGAQGALLALQARFDTLPKISREMAAYRGAQLLSKLEKGGAGAFRALGAEEQNAVMALVENAGLRRAAQQVNSLEEVRAAYQAEEIAQEVSPSVPRDAPTEPITGIEPDAPELAPAAAAEDMAAHAAVQTELPIVDAPAENSRVFLKSPEGNVEYTLGKKLGAGASSSVFEVLKIGETEVSEPMVIKFTKHSDEFGTAQEQIQRMMEANEYLKAARSGPAPIEFAEIIEAHPNADQPYLLQKKVGQNGEVFIKARDLMQYVAEGLGIGMPLDYPALAAKFPPGMQRAVIRLYYSLGKNLLVSPDLSLPNLYFKRVGNEWVAGILDVDHIVNARNIGDNVTWKWVRKIASDPARHGITSMVVDGRTMRHPLDFMEKMLEFGRYGGNLRVPWIDFNDAAQQFAPMLLDPELVKEYFPNFGKGLAPPLPVKHGGLLIPFRYLAAAPPSLSRMAA